MQACKHLISRLYTVSPKGRERFYYRIFLLHVKGAKTVAKVRRVKCVRYRRFRRVCNVYALLADDVDCRPALSYLFGSRNVELTPVFATIPASCNILANCKPGSPQDLWNDYCSEFINEICNRFRRYWFLPDMDSDASAYVPFRRWGIIFLSKIEFQIFPNPVLEMLKIWENLRLAFWIFSSIDLTNPKFVMDISRRWGHNALTWFSERSQSIHEIFRISFRKAAIDLLQSL